MLDDSIPRTARYFSKKPGTMFGRIWRAIGTDTLSRNVPTGRLELSRRSLNAASMLEGKLQSFQQMAPFSRRYVSGRAG